MGRYPLEAEAEFEDGTKYIVGAGVTVYEATKLRDDYILQKILDSLPDNLQGK